MINIQSFVSQHQDFFIIFVWPTLTALLSFLLKTLSSNPKTIAVANILLALGFDARKLVESAKSLTDAQKEEEKKDGV